MTKITCTLALAGAATCLAAGCVLFQKSPAEKAAAAERLQCEGPETPPADVELIRSAKILSVEQQTALNMSSGGYRVVGTKMTLRPPEGVTPDRMTRVLQCHGARAFLNRADRAQIPHDPYFLPDAWVSIDVKVENGNYVVLLSSDTVPDNLRVLQQANDFAAAQRTTAPSAP